MSKLIKCFLIFAAISVSSTTLAAQQLSDHIVSKEGKYYLLPGYSTEDVAIFFWQSLNRWSEQPDNVAKYFTPAGEFELVYAPVDDFPMFSRGSKGREAMTAYFTKISAYLEDLRYSKPQTWTQLATDKPGVYVFEYSSSGFIRSATSEDKKSKSPKKPYHQNFISIVTVSPDGQLKHVKEYWDPYVALRDFHMIEKTPPQS
ncbi:nuclear transport factor 2 family protein [Yersinia nurmii]|uniref:Nuclear transport factor 2 family protein n=1 Tax=Yersinia nurmii TaxID=685706 RepID=A0AAW7K0T4_9GAMM|nr:nuclear transport factor 2 family protein [Yersinia nurmii]MDN0088723.1 nuclear transport factor 2 family protein [Yersinia nurmii]CNE95224.1 Uncharacterised protein [Yersinia nurmii]